MTDNSSPTAEFLRKLSGLLETVVGNLGVFLVMLVGLGMYAVFIRDGADWVEKHGSATLALVFICVCGVAWAVVLALAEPKPKDNAHLKTMPGFMLGFVTAAAMVWIYVFGVLSFLLMKLGLLSYELKVAPAAALPDFCDAYLWHFLGLIPTLRVNEALGWEADVNLNGGARGFLLLLFRIVIVFQVFAIGRRLLSLKASPQAPVQPRLRWRARYLESLRGQACRRFARTAR